MFTKLVALFAGMSVVIAGCQTTPVGKDDVLLKIGPWQLDTATCEYIINSPSWIQLTPEQQRERMIAEGRILAFALDQRYDTISLIHCQLEHAMQYYTSSVDGYVWNKKVKPLLQVSDEAVHQAHALRTQEYKIETIYFSKEALLKEYYTMHQAGLSVKDFYALQQKVKGVPGTNIFSGYLRYPFYPLGVYLPALEKAAEGTVWGPVEALSGYYFVYLADKRPLAPVPIAQEQEHIREELRLAIKEKAIWESRQQVLHDMKPVLYEAAIADIASKVDTTENKWRRVNPELVLMAYEWKGTRRNYTLSHFTEYVRCQPAFSGSLSNAGDIRQMLYAWLIGIHLYAQGQSMDMERDSAYQQFRDRYRQQLFVSYYKSQHIDHQLETKYAVSVDQLAAYLEKRKAFQEKDDQ
ncbi:MAG: peptidylprolyl isomerase [Niastella sp.]|nr:peptidylprolyl isomerase [Niastella sp.]